MLRRTVGYLTWNRSEVPGWHQCPGTLAVTLGDPGRWSWGPWCSHQNQGVTWFHQMPSGDGHSWGRPIFRGRQLSSRWNQLHPNKEVWACHLVIRDGLHNSVASPASETSGNPRPVGWIILKDGGTKCPIIRSHAAAPFYNAI